MLNEFYRITFQKKLYGSIEELHADLDQCFDRSLKRYCQIKSWLLHLAYSLSGTTLEAAGSRPTIWATCSLQIRIACLRSSRYSCR